MCAFVPCLVRRTIVGIVAIYAPCSAANILRASLFRDIPGKRPIRTGSLRHMHLAGISVARFKFSRTAVVKHVKR
jgi:hypothetical protein